MPPTPPETSTPWYQGDELLASAVVEQREEQAPAPDAPRPERRREPGGHTYVIRGVGTGLHKIGRTTGDPRERLQKLQTGSPVVLELVVVLEHVRWETVLHHHYRDQRRQGEWFELDARDLRQIRAWSVSTTTSD